MLQPPSPGHQTPNTALHVYQLHRSVQLSCSHVDAADTTLGVAVTSVGLAYPLRRRRQERREI